MLGKRMSLTAFLGSTVVGIGLLTTSVFAEEIAGAIPSASGTFQPHHTSDWWHGVWATRMTDPARGDLAAHTRLRPDGSYVTSLIYNDGTKIEHWGTYDISFDGNGSRTGETVAPLVNVTVKIEDALSTFGVEIAGAIPAQPNTSTVPCICERGAILYNVKGSTPTSLSFSNPVRFDFEVLKDGYVKATGPGAESAISRRYSVK